MFDPGYHAAMVLVHIKRFGPLSLTSRSTLIVNGENVDVQEEIESLGDIGYLADSVDGYVLTPYGVKYLIESGHWHENSALQQMFQQIDRDLAHEQIEQQSESLRTVDDWRGSFHNAVTARLQHEIDNANAHQATASLTFDDCAMFWDLKIRVDDDMRGAS